MVWCIKELVALGFITSNVGSGGLNGVTTGWIASDLWKMVVNMMIALFVKYGSSKYTILASQKRINTQNRMHKCCLGWLIMV